MRLVVAAALVALISSPSGATEFKPVSERNAFVDLVKDRNLRLGMWDVNLSVLPDGQISGDMLGWDVTGTWAWKEGYFCREMDWSGYPIELNCQLVESDGTSAVRFTVDRGAGRSATFALQ